MKSNLASYRSYKSKPRSSSSPKRPLTATQQQIIKIRQNYKPKLPDKKPICPNVLVKRIRPENIKINRYIFEEEAFGLKPFDKNELEEIFYLKGWKKIDSLNLNMRLFESETYKMMHDINYLNSFKDKTRIMDLVEEKKLTEMWKKGMR